MANTYKSKKNISLSKNSNRKLSKSKKVNINKKYSGKQMKGGSPEALNEGDLITLQTTLQNLESKLDEIKGKINLKYGIQKEPTRANARNMSSELDDKSLQKLNEILKTEIQNKLNRTLTKEKIPDELEKIPKIGQSIDKLEEKDLKELNIKLAKYDALYHHIIVTFSLDALQLKKLEEIKRNKK